MPSTADELQVSLLARTHALFLPLRNPESPTWAAIWDRRIAFATGGHAWSVSRSKQMTEALKALEEAGLARRIKGEARTLGVLLTAEGIRSAGVLIGRDYWDADNFAAEVARLSKAYCGRPDAWVAEVAFTGGRGWGDGHSQELVAVEEAALQALAAGLVVSNADFCGRVGYRVTELGLESVRRQKRQQARKQVDSGLVKLYYEMLDSELAKLSALPRPRGNIGAVPLSPSHWIPFFTDDGQFISRPAVGRADYAKFNLSPDSF